MRVSIARKTILVLALLGVGIGPGIAGDNNVKLIAHARSAAPPSIGANATVVIKGEVVAKGSNGWTCMPEVMAGDGSAVCIDATWGEMMAAFGAKAVFTPSGIGISYMLQGDAVGGGVSNSDPYHKDPRHADDYTETGPHLMIIAPKKMLKGMTDDPASGGPYVMWKDTDYAHIMIPVDRSK